MKTRLALVICLPIVLAILASGIASMIVCDALATRDFFCSSLDKFGDYYAANLRASLFAGFLTLGGFLLSLKTFIIVNMKKEVYDQPTYQDEWAKLKKLDGKGLMTSPYQQLQQLSNVLYFAILSCVVTAVSQLSLGLVGSFWSSIVCITLAAISIGFLLLCLLIIRGNLNEMFVQLEKARKAKSA